MMTQEQVESESAGRMKPCPFCGSPAQVKALRWSESRKMLIYCESCDIAPGVSGMTTEDTLKKWNTRADESNT